MTEASKMTWQSDNKFVPPYASENLKWFERDGLETWYRQNKCREFLEDTDLHFEQRQISNFDMIRNGEKLDKKTIEQYQKIDHEEITKYPPECQQQIMSSIFRNIGCRDMDVNKKIIQEHFAKNKKIGIARDKFLRQCKDDMYAKFW